MIQYTDKTLRRTKMFSFIPDHYFLLVFGLILLIKGGDWFVDAASGIAKRFHLPELLIGATVVSIGTTLPEVMTSAMGAIAGNGAMAYGNALGSIICNTALISAITVSIKPGKVDKKALIFPVCTFFGVSLFYALVAYVGGEFTRWSGIVLITAFVAYMVITVVNMLKNPVPAAADEHLDAPEIDDGESSSSLIKDIVMLVVSALVIAVGAYLLVESATTIAVELGVPQTVISLTIVALGTSLPELVTAITALAKGHGALSLGNIIGANIFNLVLVSGVAVTINPFAVPSEATFLGLNTSLVFDIPLFIGVMAILTIPTIIRGKLARWQGITLLSLYAAYCVLQFVLIPMMP